MNNHFLLRFHSAALDIIFVQVTFSMLGASFYNFENKGKYYLHLRATEGQWLIYMAFPFILVIRERILGAFFWPAWHNQS